MPASAKFFLVSFLGWGAFSAAAGTNSPLPGSDEAARPEAVSAAPGVPGEATVATVIALPVDSASSAAVPPAMVPALGATEAGAALDTIPLLPDHISPIEKLLWGEHGWVRSLASDPLNKEDREKEMRVRRAMLTTHQIMGFCTLGSLITTLVYGQMVLDGRGDMRRSHFMWADISIASYSLTALLALASPPPLVRRPGWNTIKWHKALACVHFTGMVLTPILGSIIKGQIRQGENPVGLERFHQISGYVTTSALAAAMMVVTF